MKMKLEIIRFRTFNCGTTMYWTIWDNKWVPLIKYDDIFVPVYMEDSSKMILALKTISVAMQRIKGVGHSREEYECMHGWVMGNTSCIPNRIDWSGVMFNATEDYGEDGFKRVIKEIQDYLVALARGH